MKRGSKKVLYYTGMILLALIFLVPFYIMIVNAFKTKPELFANVLALPETLSFDNFKEAWERMEFGTAFFWTLLITAVSNILIVLVSAPAAWVLARSKTKTSSVIFNVFIAAMLIPFQVVMLTLVWWFDGLGLLSLPGLIVAYIGFGVSFSIFLYHGFISSVPAELEEAALIDGATTRQVFWKVVFPMLKPITFTLLVLNVLWIWNDYLLPTLVLPTGIDTIQMAVYDFFGAYSIEWTLAMAALVLAIIPLMIFYFFAQKYIVKGVSAGSIK